MPQDNSWEKLYAEKFFFDAFYSTPKNEEIKSFISNMLVQQKQEFRKTLEGLKMKLKECKCPPYAPCDCAGINIAREYFNGQIDATIEGLK